MTTKELMQNYYESINKKSNAWQELWSEEAYFCDASKTLMAKGKYSVIQSFIPFLKGVQEVNVKQMIVEHEYICAIISYVYKNLKDEILHQDAAEIWQVKDEKLINLVIYFDITAYRSFMKS